MRGLRGLHLLALALSLLPSTGLAGEPIGEPIAFDFFDEDVDVEWEEGLPEARPIPPSLAAYCAGRGMELATVYDEEETDDEIGYACLYGGLIRFYDLEGRELELWETPLESVASPFDFLGGMGLFRVGAGMIGRAAQYTLRARAAAGYGARFLTVSALRAAGVHAIGSMRRVYFRLTPRRPPFNGLSISSKRAKHVQYNHVRHPSNPRMNRCRSLFDPAAFGGAQDRQLVDRLFAEVEGLLAAQPSRWRRALVKNGQTGFTRRVRFPRDVGFDIEKGNRPTRWVRVLAGPDGRVATMYPDTPGRYDRGEMRRRGCSPRS